MLLQRVGTVAAPHFSLHPMDTVILLLCLLRWAHSLIRKGQRGCYGIVLQRLRHHAPKATVSCSILACFSGPIDRAHRPGKRGIARQTAEKYGKTPWFLSRVSHLIPPFFYDTYDQRQGDPMTYVLGKRGTKKQSQILICHSRELGRHNGVVQK